MDENNVEEVVIIRTFNKEKDQALIYATWRNGAYYGTDFYEGEHNDKLNDVEERKAAHEFFRKKTQEIKEIIDLVKIRVACFKNNMNVIVGYSISTKFNLDWIFVKPDYRQKGIGNILLPKNTQTVSGNNLTKLGKELALKKKLSFTGETNGRNAEPIKDKEEINVIIVGHSSELH